MAIYSDNTYIGTATNRIYFNDYTTSPVYRIVSRAPQRRQIRELDIPVPFENGISDFETLIGQTAYVIEGKMYPGGESEYDAGLAALRKLASLDISQDDALSDDGYVPYVWSEYSRQKQLFVKVLYVQITEDTRQGLVQPFRLICKVKDPTIFGVTLKAASTEAADFTTASGSAVYPFAYPIIFGASTSSVTVDANNLGDLPVYPIGITIYGPVNVPKITNTTTGEYIEVDVNLTTVSNTLTIAYDKDSLRVEADGVSQLSKVSSGSTYFKIHPGSNTFTLTGSSISDGAYAVVSFYDGWPLS